MAWAPKGRAAALVAAAMLAAGLAGCGGDESLLGGLGEGPEGDDGAGSGAGSDETAAATTTTTGPPRPMEVLWSTRDVHFASRPVLSGGLLVAYVATGTAMELAAFDPATGAEVWRRATTPSLITAGVGIPVVADDRLVFHLTPRGDAAAAVEAVDAATGEPAWITDASADGFGDVLEFCLDSPQQLCVTALDTEPGTLWRLDAANGAVTRTAGFPGRELAAGLYDLRDGDDEQVAGVAAGEITWQRPPSELFQGHDVTSDHGWHWQDHDGLLVGWLGTRQEWPEDGELAFVPQHMAGVDAATGETRWVAEGAPSCGSRLWGLTLRVNELEPSIRCRMAGSYHLAGGRVDRTVVTDAVMEGFDPATGEATWTVPLGAASALSDDVHPLVRLGPTRFALTRDDGSRVAVDVVSGTAEDVAADVVGWCVSENRFDLGGGTDSLRLGQDFTTPCRVDGTPLPAPVAPDEALGPVVDDRFAWVDAGGLHVARVAG